MINHGRPWLTASAATTELEPPPPDTAKPRARPAKKPRRRPQTKDKTKPQPPYAVILHNDRINGFDFVVGVLCKVFRYGTARAFWLTLRAHVTGRSIVWSGSLEVAELKADQIRSCGPDPNSRSLSPKPLRVTVEPQA